MVISSGHRRSSYLQNTRLLPRGASSGGYTHGFSKPEYRKGQPGGAKVSSTADFFLSRVKSPEAASRHALRKPRKETDQNDPLAFIETGNVAVTGGQVTAGGGGAQTETASPPESAPQAETTDTQPGGGQSQASVSASAAEQPNVVSEAEVQNALEEAQQAVLEAQEAATAASGSADEAEGSANEADTGVSELR